MIASLTQADLSWRRNHFSCHSLGVSCFNKGRGKQVSTFEFDDSLSEAGKVDTASLPEANLQQKAPAAAPAKAAGAPRGQIYTVMAREGVNAAEVVNTAMKKREVGKDTPRRVEVIAPHGPSTSGGKKARQSITLVPVSGQGAGLMFGFMDVAQKSVELRDYALVAEQFRKRFGTRFDVTAEEYTGLTSQLTGMLETLGFKVAAEPAGEPASPASASTAQASHERAGDDEGNEEFVLTGTERAKLAWLAGGALLLITLLVFALR
jgi:hypothetical protein